MVYNYVRASKDRQLENSSFEQQKQEILQKYPDAIVLSEQITDETDNFPIFDKMLNELKPGDKVCMLNSAPYYSLIDYAMGFLINTRDKNIQHDGEFLILTIGERVEPNQ